MTKTTKIPPSPLQGTDPLLTLADLAALEQVSLKTMRRAAAAGLLQVVRVGPSGRLVRVTPAAYRAYRAHCAERV